MFKIKIFLNKHSSHSSKSLQRKWNVKEVVRL